MKTYELVVAFRMKEGQDVAGIEGVKKILTDAKAVIAPSKSSLMRISRTRLLMARWVRSTARISFRRRFVMNLVPQGKNHKWLT